MLAAAPPAHLRDPTLAAYRWHVSRGVRLDFEALPAILVDKVTLTTDNGAQFTIARFTAAPPGQLGLTELQVLAS